MLTEHYNQIWLYMCRFHRRVHRLFEGQSWCLFVLFPQTQIYWAILHLQWCQHETSGALDSRFHGWRAVPRAQNHGVYRSHGPYFRIRLRWVRTRGRYRKEILKSRWDLVTRWSDVCMISMQRWKRNALWRTCLLSPSYPPLFMFSHGSRYTPSRKHHERIDQVLCMCLLP